jgi:hypothetical protein
MLLVDVLVEFGAMLQQVYPNEDPDEDNLILKCLQHQYQCLITQVIDLVRTFVSDNPSSFLVSTILGMLNLVASTSLLPYRSFYHETIQQVSFEKLESGPICMARQLAHESFQNLEAANTCTIPKGWISIFATLRTSVFQYRGILQSWRMQEDFLGTHAMELFGHCRHSADLVRQNNPAIKGAKQFTKQSIIWTLMHFQNLLEYHGDSLRATVVALWALTLVDDDDTGESNWLRAMAITSWMHGGSTTRALKLSVDESFTSSDPVATPRSTAWIATCELILAEIRLGFTHPNRNPEYLSYPNENLEIMKTEVESTDFATDENIRLLSQWLLSTIELTHSEIAASAGFFSQALLHIQLCIRHCQTVMSKSQLLFKSHEDEPFWLHVACSTLFTRASQRYTESLSRKSQLYYRIGDHRKATSYTLSIANFLGIDPSSRGKDRRTNLQDLVSSFTKATLVRQRRYLRVQVELQCLSSAYDLVVRSFSCSTLQALSLKVFDAPKEDRDILSDLEALQDLLSGKWCYRCVNNGPIQVLLTCTWQSMQLGIFFMETRKY